MKTIKELETSIGVSKVSLYALLKKPPFNNYVHKDKDNRTLVDDEGEKLLNAYYNKQKTETIKDMQFDKIDDSDSKAFNQAEQVKSIELIEFLQEQVKIKDDQIKSLTNIILNQQQIQGVKLITENDVSNVIDEEKKGKQGFFARLFSK